MIAKLTGILDQIGQSGIVVDVGGVGYLIACSSTTIGRLPRVGEQVSLLIETHVREDAIQLYGFPDRRLKDTLSFPAFSSIKKPTYLPPTLSQPGASCNVSLKRTG